MGGIIGALIIIVNRHAYIFARSIIYCLIANNKKPAVWRVRLASGALHAGRIRRAAHTPMRVSPLMDVDSPVSNSEIEDCFTPLFSASRCCVSFRSLRALDSLSPNAVAITASSLKRISECLLTLNIGAPIMSVVVNEFKKLIEEQSPPTTRGARLFVRHRLPRGCLGFHRTNGLCRMVEA